MPDLAYTGAVARVAHYGRRPPPAGINSEHLDPSPDPDPFNPQPDTPPNQAGTVFGDPGQFAGQSNQPALAAQPITHWYNGQEAVPSNVETATRMDAMAERMMVDHSDTNYVPDSIRLYLHATEGQQNGFIVGRAPREAGATVDGPLAALQNGRNGYDATNAPNEVYQGDPANVGRYRLGVKTTIFGLYENPHGKFGQEALARAYTGLFPQFPVDKPRVDNSAPYTPNSSGTTHSAPAQPNQVVSNFALPSETTMTDFASAVGGGVAGSEFDDGGRL